MNSIKWTFLLLIVLAFFACNSSSSDTGSEVSDENVVISEDFDNFYKKFHRDSTFQMAHINFPLPGQPSFQDSLSNEEFYWQEADWLIQHEVDFSTGDFRQEFTNLENLVIERVFLVAQGFYIERRFYNADGKWSLIYYSDLNYGQPK